MKIILRTATCPNSLSMHVYYSEKSYFYKFSLTTLIPYNVNKTKIVNKQKDIKN